MLYRKAFLLFYGRLTEILDYRRLIVIGAYCDTTGAPVNLVFQNNRPAT